MKKSFRIVDDPCPACDKPGTLIWQGPSRKLRQKKRLYAVQCCNPKCVSGTGTFLWPTKELAITKWRQGLMTDSVLGVADSRWNSPR